MDSISCSSSKYDSVLYTGQVRLVILLLASVSSVLAQAEISGVVQDPAGLPAPNAAVNAEEQSTLARFHAISDARGTYRLLGLPAGAYVLNVEHPGFRSYRRSGITVRGGDRVVLNLQLELGSPVGEAVEVRGSAPLLET